jgi:dsRNA-specific ribonuclease
LDYDQESTPLSWLYKNISNSIKDSDEKLNKKEQERDSKNKKTYSMQRQRTR